MIPTYPLGAAVGVLPVGVLEHALHEANRLLGVLEHLDHARLDAVAVALLRAVLAMKLGLVVVARVADVGVAERHQLHVHVAVELLEGGRQLADEEALAVGTQRLVVHRQLSDDLGMGKGKM